MHNPLVLIGIAVSLAMDTFAVSIGCSTVLQKLHPRQVFRLSFHFGLFQAMMPLIGWFAGRTVAGAIGAVDHWVAFGILAIVGLKMICESLETGEHCSSKSDPTKGISLISLSVATSLDALAVGVTFSMLKVRIWTAALVIGLVAAASTVLGMTIGGRLGVRFGKRMEMVGGLILIAIGVRIVLEHTGVW